MPASWHMVARPRHMVARPRKSKSFMGCIYHKTIEGKGLLRAVNIDGKGMGLKVVGKKPIKEGEIIAYGEGTVIGMEDINTDNNKNKYKLYINETSCLLLHDARSGYLANLVNTAGGKNQNNAKLTYDGASNLLCVRAIRDIWPGEEVTAPYGATFTRYLSTNNQPLTNSNFNNFVKSARIHR